MQDTAPTEIERALFAEWNQHLRAAAQTYTTVFLLFVTASAAVAGFSSASGSTLHLTYQQWLVIAAFGAVSCGVMSGLRAWKNQYLRAILKILKKWNVSGELNVFGRGFGVDNAMLTLVALVSLASFVMFCVEARFVATP